VGTTSPWERNCATVPHMSPAPVISWEWPEGRSSSSADCPHQKCDPTEEPNSLLSNVTIQEQVTQPPCRLRMVCSDILCRRAMEVEWENGSGTRQTWSSATDQFCSWFEAEKLLPASVTSISVRFRVITALGDKTVYKVDRPNMCAWIRDESQKYMAECIWMRSTDSTSDEPVDSPSSSQGPAPIATFGVRGTQRRIMSGMLTGSIGSQKTPGHVDCSSLRFCCRQI